MAEISDKALPPPQPLPKARKSDLRKPKRAAVQKATRRKVAEPSAHTVFISHFSKGLWIAGQIAKEIELLGAKSWLDKRTCAEGTKSGEPSSAGSAPARRQ
jgi:hypothetical protein